ncbi:hypothetical protein CSB66_3847 [Enterobacter hormaechei]|nr:hypothetical protein CSB66_3847 [Enterobacter hormaechei]
MLTPHFHLLILIAQLTVFGMEVIGKKLLNRDYIKDLKIQKT